MLFESEKDALDWYQKDERVLTKEFIDHIPWHEVKNHPLDERFLPVITYMRDIETMTEVYFEELMKSPTAKDPIIRNFMEQWVTEEPVHGEMLNRFMEEAGYPSDKDWKQQGFDAISLGYKARSVLSRAITLPFGKRFTSVHMTWGAINEYSTLTGYRRLWEMAGHPVLEHILRGIVREEAKHAMFYWSVARINLRNSAFRQKLARYIVDRFWSPVGQGIKSEEDSNLVIKTLFAGRDGVDTMKRYVNDRVAQLPGFEDLTRVTDRVANIVVQQPKTT